LIAAACVLAASIAAAVAEETNETTTFGKDGIAVHSLGIHYEETGFFDVEARGDGGLVAQRDVHLLSYLANGAPDPAAPPRRAALYRKVFPLADGKSLVLHKYHLTRFNGDGSVDTSFGGTGTVEVEPAVSTVAQLPSGKVLLAGTSLQVGTAGLRSSITVQLVNPDGSPDRGVGEDGVLGIPLSPANEGTGTLEVSPTPEGGALLSANHILLELKADGAPNPGFGSDGMLDDLPPLVSGRVLPDGSVAAVGWDSTSGKKDLLVLHYTAAGAPDPGFGKDGVRRFDLGGEEEAHVAMWSADGSVIVGGSDQFPGPCYLTDGCEEVPIVVRFDPAGDLDSSFGSNGVLRLAALAGPSRYSEGRGVEALVRRPDGSIVAAGSAPPEWTTAFLAAFSPGGALLPGFGESGIVSARLPRPATQTIAGILPLAGGKLLAAGVTDVGIDDAAVLIRYAADGSLDRSFGAGAGYVEVGRGRFVIGFAIDSGRVLTSIYGYPRSRLLELRAADGAPEPSFGSGGVVLLPKRVRPEEVGFGADGGPIVIGTRRPAGAAEPGVVVRYRPDGKLARGFGHNGMVDLRGPGGREVRVRALAVGRKGRILVGGVCRGRLAVGQLLPDGRPDPRFGSGGWMLADGGMALTSLGGTARSVALKLAGSQIYLAGTVQSRHGIRVVLLRLNADGRPDRTFGRAGRRTTSISGSAEPTAIVVTRRGVLVVLNRGPRPLLLFGHRGKVLHQTAGPRPQLAGNVRATVAQGHLILGWGAFSQATHRPVYYLAKR
jgi:uncharacterized delta-60 repeat protein